MLGDGLPATIAKGKYPRAIVDGRLYQFIVFSPQSPQSSYSDKEIKYMLPYLISKYRIDTTRIYVTGISTGAAGAYSYITISDSFLANKIVAVVAVSPPALDFQRMKILKKALTTCNSCIKYL